VGAAAPLGVGVTHRHSRTLARFRRSEWEQARDRGMEPPAPRREAARAVAPAEAKAPREGRAGRDFDDKLKRLKGGRG
jgi:hypothetical protein